MKLTALTNIQLGLDLFKEGDSLECTKEIAATLIAGNSAEVFVKPAAAAPAPAPAEAPKTDTPAS
jgi:hypothetical protein